MSPRSTPHLLGAATLCAGLVLVGPTSYADENRLVPDDSSTSAVIQLGGPDRVLATPVDDSRSILQPLARPDGTTPGLLVTTVDGATTVESTESDAGPALVSGSLPKAAATDADDLVELRFEAVGRDGRAAIAHLNVFDVATGGFSAYRTLPADPEAECTSTPSSSAGCILVPRGTYSLMALVTTMPKGTPSTEHGVTIQNLSLVGDAEVPVFQDRTFTFDARKATEVEVVTPNHPTKVNTDGNLELGYTRTASSGKSISVVQHPTLMLDRTFYQQPTPPVRMGELQTRARLRLEAPDIELSAPRVGTLHPEYYDRVWFSEVSSQFPVYDGRAELRVVDVGHATAKDLAGKNLRGALALVERSDHISVADQSNGAAESGAGLVAIYNDGPGDNGDPGATVAMLEVPTLRLTRAEGRQLRDLRPRDRLTVQGESVTPYVYDLLLKEDGGIRDRLTHTVRTGGRANVSTQVREFHGQPTKGSTYSEVGYPWQPGETASFSRFFPVRGGAQVRKEYRIADPETRWSLATTTPEMTYNALWPNEPLLNMSLRDPNPRTYSAGERDVLPMAAAPISAEPDPLTPIERSGDRMRVNISGFVDADGNIGTSYTDGDMSTLFQVRADDTLIAETTASPRGIAALPAGDSRVAISFTADNPQSWNELSTHTDTTWTFDSKAVPEGEVERQPVIVADYDVEVDLRNRANGRNVDLNLSYVNGAKAGAIGDVTVRASYDDGRTWRDATVRQGPDGQHWLVLPPGRGYVSLELHAADDAGSALDQRIIRAWYVR
jgi:hypothetical protein